MTNYNRLVALKNNEKYYEGSPCKFGHTTRLVSNHNCIVCSSYVPSGLPAVKPLNEAKKLAKEKGELTYFTGKSCNRGHIAARYVNSNCCVECKIEDRINNKEKIKLNAIKRNFNLLPEEYQELLKIQNNKCAICKEEFVISKFTHVDHCHETKRVRGILCNKCNTGIGQFKHNPEFLRQAALYCEET